MWRSKLGHNSPFAIELPRRGWQPNSHGAAALDYAYQPFHIFVIAFPQIVQRAASIMKPKGKANSEVEDLIVPPVEDHQQTFILLHGRGDHAIWFGGGLLDSSIPTYKFFHEAFPNAKFIFPQAPKRKCIRQPGWELFQWFDSWGYDTMDAAKEEIKVEGLKETTRMVHDLIQSEIQLIGASNIVLGGLSQGCAASMIALLTWTGEPLAGYLGMCGHLPFQPQIEATAKNSSATATKGNGALEAVEWLRSKLDLPASGVDQPVFQKTPVFIGHGDEDKVVPTQYGRDAATCFETLGAKSIYKEYKGLVHWYNDTMLEDFIRYFKSNSTWNSQTN